MTIEIHNPELEALLRQRLKAGNFASVETLLMDTFQGGQQPCNAPEDARKERARAAAERLRELRMGVTLDRPAGVARYFVFRPAAASLREYAHTGHRY